MRTRSLLVASLLGLTAVGCVPQEKYQALRIERNALNEQLSQSQSRLSAAESEKKALQRQVDAVSASGDSAAALMLNNQQRIAALEAENADLTKKYNDAVNKVASGPQLPAVLTNELTQFAAANPNLVTFDAETGMMRFKNDVTFSAGDAAIQPAAAEVIAKFAKILSGPEASKYEILVAGHADNQPVSAGTAQRGHKDNWYLSAHRALSVAEALRKQGVDGRRVGAVGFGELRPIADNSTAQGKAMNRRVEVVILPKPITATPAQLAQPAAAAAPVANTASEAPVRTAKKPEAPELSK
ncbi:MAG: OmpA family protein [Tepidisphaeraceae bacterium]